MQATSTTTKLLMLACSTASASEMLMIVLLTRQQQMDASGFSSSAIFIWTLIGTACMGFAGVRVLARFRPRKVGESVSLICTALTIVTIVVDPGPIDYVVAGLVAFVTALSLPNIISTLSAIVTAKDRPARFAALQVAANLMLIAAPIGCAALISTFGTHTTLLFIAALYAGSSVPWLWIQDDKLYSNIGTPKSSPYKLIFHYKSLRGLMICRLFSNLVYTGLPVALPILLVAISINNVTYVWLQATSITMLRAGLLVASFGGMLIFAKKPALVVPISIISPIVAASAAVMLAFSSSALIILISCMIVGIAQFGSRLTGLVLGPSVTAPNRLAEVILASDTLVRVSAAIYAALLLLTMHVVGEGAIPFSLAAIGALPAPLFLSRAIQGYRNQLRAQ